jgi:hypothetical protein
MLYKIHKNVKIFFEVCNNKQILIAKRKSFIEFKLKK